MYVVTASTVKRRYTDPALYSPRLAQQAPVPTTGLSTEVYDTFVAQMPSLSGRTAFVTGANTGLGYHAARALAARGARVVLLCRDVHKADTAKREMLADDATLAIETEHLDLSSLAQVRECAAELRARFAKCDVLLLNAGVMGVQHTLTEDGHDVQLQANHLGHFLLVHELLPLLLAAGGEEGRGPARVVSHSSNAHWMVWPSFSAADADGACGGGFRALPWHLCNWLPGGATWARYGQSKLCNLLFTLELQRRLEARGLGGRLQASCAHPGVAVSQLFQVAAGASFFPGWHKMGSAGVAQSPQDGCTPLLLAATGADVRGGEYFGPANGAKGPPARATVRGYGRDEAMTREMWAWSESACALPSFGGW